MGSDNSVELVADIRSGCAAIYPKSESGFANGLHPTDHGRDIYAWYTGESKNPSQHGYPDITDEQRFRLERMAACWNAMRGIPDPAAFVEAANGWKAALEKIAQHEEAAYGYFHGGDPRKFCPDGEGNTDDERKAHEEACKAFDDADAKGEPLPPMRCASGALPCGVHLLKSQFGLGVYSYPSPCAMVAQEALGNTGKAVG